MAPLTEFVCTECGNVTGKWAGQCPDCGEWNSLEERARSGKTGQGGKSIAKGGATSASAPAKVKKLSEHKPSDFPRFSTNIAELDRVLGGGVVPGSAVVLSGEPGSGKALDLDTPLPTLEGWTTMGDVKVGDYLFDEQGQPCSILAISEVMHNRDVYKVSFNDGSSILADGKHLWSTFTQKQRHHAPVVRGMTGKESGRGVAQAGRRVEVDGVAFHGGHYAGSFPTEQLTAGVALEKQVQLGMEEYNTREMQTFTTEEIAGSIWSGTHRNHAIPVTQALQVPEVKLPISPYILGLWCGDSNTGDRCITPADKEIVENIQAQGYQVKESGSKWTSYRWCVLGLKAQLRSLGILNNKHIPKEYLRSSETQRRNLLAGLLDSGGSPTKSGSTNSCEFYNTNLRLAQQTYELVVSLGYQATIGKKRAFFNGKDCGDTWTVTFAAGDQSPFRRSGKIPWQTRRKKPTHRMITSVDKVSSRPVRCIQVASSSQLFLAGEAMIPTHNSTLSSMVVDQLAGSGKRVAYIAGEESGEQIRLRTDRLGLTHSAGIDLSNEIEIGAVCSLLASGYDFAVVDSIQTLYDSELSGAPGSVSIVKQVGQALVRTAKESGVALFLIGHVTKEGNLAGPRHLEHMVDVVLGMEGERVQAYRVLRAQKNRFGSTNEIGVFEMTGKGLLEVSDPTTIFLQDHDQQLSGSVICPTVEGTRPMLVEVQSLAQPVAFANAPPLRRVRGIDKNRLDMLIAVLQRHGRAQLKLGAKDIYVNVSGGLRVEEPAFDLAVCIAIASAASGRPVRKGTSVFGEVSLLGEVRPVNQADRRLVEATKLGWPRVVAGGGQGNESVRYLSQAIHAALEKESGQGEEE